MDNFDFNLIGDSEHPFIGYVSSLDKTSVSFRASVRGSKNVYKKLSGTYASRDGLRTYGPTDSTVAGITSSFDWNNSTGRTYGMNVQGETISGNDGKLRVLWDETEYDLLTGLSLTRFSFDTWWDDVLKKDVLVMANGDTGIKSWGGGITTVSGGAATTITKSSSATTWAQDGFDNLAAAQFAIGAADTQFDITNPSGTTFRYTFDGTGTNPNIDTASVPVGSYVLLGAQNFTAANNGLFVVTGSGSNYFEVTNAAGVAESNKTIGTGFVYSRYTKVVIIGGTAYAYTGGESSQTLTGVVPSAAAIVAGSAVQAVMSWGDIPADGFLPDIVRTINNQVWVGSYGSRVVYVSASDDFTDYTVPTPTVAGSPELLILDDLVNNISVKSGQAYISAGYSYWYNVQFANITVGAALQRQTIVNPQIVDSGATALANEFVDGSGGDLVFLSKGQQLITFGLFKDLAEGKYPVLSQPVYSELQQEDFDGGHLKTIGDITYITAPNGGRVWMHQTRTSLSDQGQVVAERLWHPPQVTNISRMASLGGVTYGWSNANPMVYRVWDTGQWHDDSPSGEPLAYECVLRMAYKRYVGKNGTRRQGYTSIDKAYYEGYIANGVNLNGRVYMDYQGSSGLQDFVINSVDDPATFFSGNNAPSLGDSSLGDNPLGDGLLPESNDQELLPKFRRIRTISRTDANVFEYQMEVYSTDLDCRWEILCLGANDTLSTQNPSYLVR